MTRLVVVRRSMLSANLHAWGRARDGWWGGLTWHQRVMADGAEALLPCAAWVPAGELKAHPRTGDEPVDRLDLPADRADWPVPKLAWPCWFVGAWTDGPPAALPGLELVEGATWRRKRTR